MGLPVLPSSKVVKSLVRLPDSGWNTSLSSTILDLSRSSSLAATVYVRGGPFPTTTEQSQPIIPPSNTLSKIAGQDLRQQPKLSQSSNSEAVSTGEKSKTNSKNTLSKKSETIAKGRTIGTKSTAERKRKLPDDLRENSEIHVNNACSSKAPRVYVIPGRVQTGQIYVTPVNSIMQYSQLQQPQPQLLQSNGNQSAISKAAASVSRGSHQRNLLLSTVPLQTVMVKSNEQQQQQQQQQQGTAANPPLTHTLSGLFPAGHVGKKILQETEQLRAANTTLKQELEKYRKLFRDKQRLTAVVSHLFTQPMVH